LHVCSAVPETAEMGLKVSGFSYTVRKAGAGKEDLDFSYLLRVQRHCKYPLKIQKERPKE